MGVRCLKCPKMLSVGLISRMRSRRDLEVPVSNHPEGPGDKSGGRTAEGRQVDANLNVSLAAASNRDDALRNGQGARPGLWSPIGPLAMGWGPPMHETVGQAGPDYVQYQYPAIAHAPNFGYPSHLIHILWVFRVLK